MNSTTNTLPPLPFDRLTQVDPLFAALAEQGALSALLERTPAAWEMVKHNASRTVYRGCFQGQTVYVKHFHRRSLLRRLAAAARRGDGDRELRCLQMLTREALPCPQPVGLLTRAGQQWLLTREVAPATPADVWHANQLSDGRQGRRNLREFAGRLARIIGQMHRLGLLHGDLHCGNVLVRTDGRGPRPVLMDLHRVRRTGRPSRRAMAENLAQLYHDRHELTTRTERLRFLRDYLAAAGAAGSLRGWSAIVESLAHDHRQRLYAQRDRRIGGDGRYFARLNLPRGFKAHVVLASKRRPAGSLAAGMTFTAEQWRSILADPQKLFQGPGVQKIKDSASSLIVRRQLQIGEHRVDVFVKRSRRKRPWKLLLDCCRPGRSLRAFRLGHMLLTRRVATALPLAALERRRGPLLLDSILIAEAVEAPWLNQFLNKYLASPPPSDVPLSLPQQLQLARETLWQLGRLLQRLHDNNFAHRDLKEMNILVRYRPGQPPEIVLVDLDGLSRRWRLSARRKFQGLMRLNVSLLCCPVVNRAGRMRMLTGYLRRPGSGRINFKPYWHTLQDWSHRKLRRQIRSRQKRQKASRRGD